LRIPGFTETNLFDALYDTLDRAESIEGRKYVILITTGVDTFSKLNLDQIMKKIKATKDITIFPVSVGFALRNYYESRGGAAPHGMGIPISNMDYLQADAPTFPASRQSFRRFFAASSAISATSTRWLIIPPTRSWTVPTAS
jgi:hypothetical protein